MVVMNTLVKNEGFPWQLDDLCTRSWLVTIAIIIILTLTKADSLVAWQPL